MCVEGMSLPERAFLGNVTCWSHVATIWLSDSNDRDFALEESNAAALARQRQNYLREPFSFGHNYRRPGVLVELYHLKWPFEK